MNKNSFLWGSATLAALVLAAGCGSQPTPTASGHHHHHKSTKSHQHSSQSPSPSPSASSSPTPTTTSSSPSSTPSAPSPVLTQVGGVATANQARVTINSVESEGQVTVSGQTEQLYLFNITLKNVTPGMILFPMSDFIIGPASSSVSSSRNDYSLEGISQQSSLFPYPIVPQHASAVVREVPSGQSVTGNMTVEVPEASQYAIWISGNPAPIAKFSA